MATFEVYRSLELDFTDRVRTLMKDCDNILWLADNGIENIPERYIDNIAKLANLINENYKEILK